MRAPLWPLSTSICKRSRRDDTMASSAMRENAIEQDQYDENAYF
jgi:hypothetical protein